MCKLIVIGGINMSKSLDALLRGPSRKIVVSLNDIDLANPSDNFIVIFIVEESSGAAGGRAAGYGSRRITKIVTFATIHGRYEKILETNDDRVISKFNIPYSAVAMDISMNDGSSVVVQGIVDPEMIQTYKHLIEGFSNQN